MNPHQSRAKEEYWPSLPAYSEWKDSCETLHLWMQIVGKIRLVQTSWVNHSWHVPFYVTTNGLTTSPMPYEMRTFQIDFDFIAHLLRISTCEGEERTLRLEPRSVASFYEELFALLYELDLDISINHIPNEMAEAVPFEKDFAHRQYDAEAVDRFRKALIQADRILKIFRHRFTGKCSPVHFFWGAMDLAVTRFSGRQAPRHPGGVPHLPDWVVREAYSQEVSSCGFWPGDANQPLPAFYAYAYPEPDGFARASVQPNAASFYSDTLKEFILPYENVRCATSPDDLLLNFLESTYDSAATLGKWNRQQLEFPEDPRQAA